MAKILKIDIINDCYSKMRISGLTTQPTPSELELALDGLEDMAAEYESRDMCAGYNFQDSPNPSDESGIERKFKQAFSGPLALRLLSNFGKQLTPELKIQADQAISNLAARTAQLRQTQYPSRQPIGSGNSLRGNRWSKFYTPVAQAPMDCSTHKMKIGEVNNFSESWADYLNTGEAIASYTTKVSGGILLSGGTLASPDISYTVTAIKAGYQSIVFTITTDAGRVEVTTVNFEVTS